MPIGIRAMNDFVFKKTFGTIANKLALIVQAKAHIKATDSGQGNSISLNSPN